MERCTIRVTTDTRGGSGRGVYHLLSQWYDVAAIMAVFTSRRRSHALDGLPPAQAAGFPATVLSVFLLLGVLAVDLTMDTGGGCLDRRGCFFVTRSVGVFIPVPSSTHRSRVAFPV